MFTGDLELEGEQHMAAYYDGSTPEKTLPHVDLFKAGHHGSKTSSTTEFLNVVKPQIAVIGVGKNNKFGHPNKEVLERYESLNSQIYRTDECGEITITNCIKITTQVNNNRK